MLVLRDWVVILGLFCVCTVWYVLGLDVITIVDSCQSVMLRYVLFSSLTKLKLNGTFADGALLSTNGKYSLATSYYVSIWWNNGNTMQADAYCFMSKFNGYCL